MILKVLDGCIALIPTSCEEARMRQEQARPERQRQRQRQRQEIEQARQQPLQAQADD